MLKTHPLLSEGTNSTLDEMGFLSFVKQMTGQKPAREEPATRLSEQDMTFQRGDRASLGGKALRGVFLPLCSHHCPLHPPGRASRPMSTHQPGPLLCSPKELPAERGEAAWPFNAGRKHQNHFLLRVTSCKLRRGKYMWPHQSGLREILRCVCYEKMEESRASCAASRGAFGFLCSPPARKLPGTRDSGARRLPPLPKPALRGSHGRAADAARHPAPAVGPRGPSGLPPILGKAKTDVLSHGVVPRNDAGPGRPCSPTRGQGAGSVPPRGQQMFPLLPARPGCL